MEKGLLNQFRLRKLHSLTGFLFLGYFLCVHVRGNGGYKDLFTRWAFLFIPLAFHGLYGLYIIYESAPNNLRYSYWRNWMYLLQRVTGVILVPFVLLHVWAMNGNASFADAAWFRAFWYTGLVSAVFHLANGLFGFAIEWGITVGPHSQKVLVALCFAAFLVLGAMGVTVLYTQF